MSSNYYTCNYCLITVQIGWECECKDGKGESGRELE